MQQRLQAFPNQDWVWSMIFHSGRIPSEAAEYQIVGRWLRHADLLL